MRTAGWLRSSQHGGFTVLANQALCTILVVRVCSDMSAVFQETVISCKNICDVLLGLLERLGENISWDLKPRSDWSWQLNSLSNECIMDQMTIMKLWLETYGFGTLGCSEPAWLIGRLKCVFMVNSPDLIPQSKSCHNIQHVHLLFGEVGIKKHTLLSQKAVWMLWRLTEPWCYTLKPV